MTKKRKAQGLPKDDGKKRIRALDSRTTEVTAVLFGSSDIAMILFSFLEARELLRFVSCSKEYLSQITYEHVIRSAMMTGGRPKENIERLVSLIAMKRIWIPTPQRMLRLVCGKYCERCNTRQVNLVSDGFGVFFCACCIEQCCTSVRPNTQKWGQFLVLHEVAQKQAWNKTKKAGKLLMNEEYRDESGALCGPLVTKQKIHEFLRDKSTKAEKKVSAWLALCDAQQPTAQTNTAQIMKAFRVIKKAAKRRQNERKEKKVQAQKKYAEARRRNIDRLLEELLELVGDVSWKSCVNNRTWLTTQRWSGHFGILPKNTYLFHHEIVQIVLGGNTLSSPTRVTKKKLKELAHLLGDRFEKRAKEEAILQKLSITMGSEDWDDLISRKVWSPSRNRYFFGYSLEDNVLKEALANPDKVTNEMLLGFAEELREIFSRQQRVDELIQELSGLISDDSAKEELTIRSWVNHRYHFQNSFLCEILHDTFDEPAKVTKATLLRLSEDINECFAKMQAVETFKSRVVDKVENWRRPSLHWLREKRRLRLGISGGRHAWEMVDSILGEYLHDPSKVTSEEISELSRQIQHNLVRMDRSRDLIADLHNGTGNYSFYFRKELEFCWDKSEKKFRFSNDVVDRILQPLLDERREYTKERLFDLDKQLSEALVEAKESTDANNE